MYVDGWMKLADEGGGDVAGRRFSREEAEAEAARQKLTAKSSVGHRGLTAAFMYSAAEFKNLGK